MLGRERGRSVMTMDREKERDLELESAMYTNCLLLGLDPNVIGLGSSNGTPRNMCALFIVYEMDLWTKSLSESVNGTNAGRKSLPKDKGPDVPADASSSKDKAP
ncbi:hypothetical protein HID58_066179 [Brassica napus]|uniref:Uncharacterized protein n=1 Tax=Brassica napus TaxID=3708 RepID=A0ABQ7ZFD3_BRANA|nr:hypothetical protein HID58_066179 [Brassica napus]